jgi:Fe2+ or Zn2+ uptake regulation protein
LYIIVDNPTTAAATLNSVLKIFTEKAKRLLVIFNSNKTKYVIFSPKNNNHKHILPFFCMNGVQINEVTTHKYHTYEENWHISVLNILQNMATT